ncbi:hypothetical protein Dimus_008941 [Dionaea muscipula]
MASMPLFEVDDQTDEDFFDKLVNDDEIVVGSIMATGLTGGSFVDGDDSEEAKTFAKLSMREPVEENEGIDSTRENGGNAYGLDLGVGRQDETVGDEEHFLVALNPVVSSEAKMLEKLSVNEVCIGYDNLEGKEEMGGDSEGRNWAGQVDEVLGGEVERSVASPDSLSFNNGITSHVGVAESELEPDLTRKNDSAHSGVKEVLWSSFSDSSTHHIDRFGSYSDFFTGLLEGAVDNLSSESKDASGNGTTNGSGLENSYNFVEHQGKHVSSVEQSTESQLLNSYEYLENINPGWKYDPNSGQWYQVDGYGETANGQQNIETATGYMTENPDGSADSHWGISDGKSPHRFTQQTTQSIAGTVGHLETATNQVLQVSNEYPAHMILDPQYPGWYYDTIAQEWRTLETYHSTIQSAVEADYQQAQNGFVLEATHSLGYDQSTYGTVGLSDQTLVTPSSDYIQQGTEMWQPEASYENRVVSGSFGDQAMANAYDSNVHSNSHMSKHNFNTMVTHASYGKSSQLYDSSSFVSSNLPGRTHSATKNLITDGSYAQQFSSSVKVESNGPLEYQNEYYGNQRENPYLQQIVPNGHQYAPHVGRSSAGRPPHALVSFGFGGKLIIIKDSSTLGNSVYRTKDAEDRSISVLNLLELTKEKDIAYVTGRSSCNYFHSLCHQSFPGPLVGGNVGNKELNKWIDDSISNCESPDMDYRKGRVLKLLLSLLKISCKHYGKLRSLGTEAALRENDLPESAVANLLASSNKDGGDFGQYYASSELLINFPSEAQMQKTASDVQNLLVIGRKKEALQHAEEGQLWAYALILARELGEQSYADTVKRMAFSQLVGGTPLRTLCLLIAKKPEDVFSTNKADGISSPGYLRASPQPPRLMGYNMLDNWEENLAAITANKTENDHLVITHLGDSLWKERNDIMAAHICYLVAEADFESYSDSARLCLIGSDHWNFQRTYASPEAIQRTELFEYSKVMGNSQFVLMPFQPYKLVYAYMLAEVGKVSDALKYCQALYKSLKTGRSPEIEALKQKVASLEDRIRTHQQGGYSVNLATAKIMGKLFNLFDSTTHRVVGGLPPPVPSTTQNSLQSYEQHQTVGPKVSGSQSTMAISSLMPSSSMEPLSQWTLDNNRMTMHNRSASEPDIGRTQRQDHVHSSNDATSTTPEGKVVVSTGPSRFAGFNFGTQILQKTVGLVLGPRNQAKLGDTNKFYYDEKLKTWVEEGAKTPVGAAAPPPPPTTTSFQSSTPDNSSQNAFSDGGPAIDSSPDFRSSTSSEISPGFPPIPHSSNQFSARGKMGVRARYVDTFNKGGGSPANLFQTPSIPSIKPANITSPTFFIPVASMSNEQASSDLVAAGSSQGAFESTESPPPVSMDEPLQNLPSSSNSSSVTITRFSSLDGIPNAGTTISSNGDGSLSSSLSTFSRPEMVKGHSIKPLGMSSLSSMPSSLSSDNLQMSGGSLGDDLQEVAL